MRGALKIADLFPAKIKVEVAPEKYLELRPVSLPEIVELFAEAQETFLALYVEGQKAEPNYAPFLLAAPGLVAKVIAISADAVDQLDDVCRLPASVQLIALSECWRISVPDPKKLQGLLFAAMDALQKLSSSVRPNVRPMPTTPDTQPGSSANSSTPTSSSALTS